MHRVLVAATFLAACAGAPGTPPAPHSDPAPPVAARILVIGDIQLASPFKASPALSTWSSGRLDTSELSARLGEAIRATAPTAILQTGDLVDLNESAVLDVRSASGAAISRSRQPLREWDPVLALFPKTPPLYPVVGNHEHYGELVVSAELAPDGDHVDIHGLELTHSLDKSAVNELLLEHFPHLKREAEFHGKSGSYYVAFERFCFLSIDGVDFDGDPSLFTFIEEKLSACNAARKTPIVSDHYPLFSGRPKAEDDSLELHAHRRRLIDTFSRQRVALVLTGHEHFYLRYLDAGRKRAGYTEDLPARPIYMTVSDFANPYSRELARLDPKTAGDGFRYFRGTHYAAVTLDQSGVSVVVRGYDREKSTWKEVDSFRVPD